MSRFGVLSSRFKRGCLIILVWDLHGSQEPLSRALVCLPLTHLALADSKVDVSVLLGLAPLPRMASDLVALNLRRTPLRDEGLEVLKALPLEALDLHGTPTTHRAIQGLARALKLSAQPGRPKMLLRRAGAARHLEPLPLPWAHEAPSALEGHLGCWPEAAVRHAAAVAALRRKRVKRNRWGTWRGWPPLGVAAG